MRFEATGLRRTAAHASRLTAAALLGLIVGADRAQAIDPFFPTFGNNGYDVKHYAVNLDVDARRHRLSGRAVLTVRATKELASFTLDLSGLEVTGVRIDGATARFGREVGKLRVRPAAPIAKGRKFTVVIAYRGAPATIPDPTVDDPSSIPGLGWSNYLTNSYVVSEPVGAGTWFPVNDEPTDKATYRVVVTVDKPFTAVSNGALRSVTDLGSRRRFVWDQAQPMASYLAIVDIGRFQHEQQVSASGIKIRTFKTDTTPPETLQALRKTPAMINYFEGLFGPYPFDAYGAVLVSDPNLYYALETQAMSTFQQDYVDEATVAHELAHQWFGDAVTVAQWRDLWLAEGFATYLELLWQYRGDRPGLESAFANLYTYVAGAKVGPAVVSRPQDLFADNTYYRGALTLHALRLHVGDRDFFRTLRAYYRTYRDKNATSADFIDVAARQSGRGGVRRLLHAWLYDQAVPPMPGAAVQARQAGAATPPALGVGVRRH